MDVTSLHTNIPKRRESKHYAEHTSNKPPHPNITTTTIEKPSFKYMAKP